MALTRDFKETVKARAECDPIFRAELRAAQLFSIVTAADFFSKVKEDLVALQARIDDPGRAINCILSSYHLHEWVWARWLKSNSPIKVRGTMVPGQVRICKLVGTKLSPFLDPSRFS